MFAFLFLINVYEISFYCSFYIDSPIFFLSDMKRKEEYVLLLYVDWQEWLH